MEYKLPKEYKKPADYTSVGYISPIQITIDTTTNKIFKAHAKAEEQLIMSTINTIVDVDREELIKALQYDRNQYDKGYQDAMSKISTKSKWVIDYDYYGNPYFKCAVCGGEMLYDKEGEIVKSDFCPHCGAVIDKEVE